MKPRRRWFASVTGWRRAILFLFLLPFVYLMLCTVGLVGLRFVDPLVTGVQAQRIAEAVLGSPRLSFQRDQVPLESISPNLRHAVVAAEDARFWTHHGIDFTALKEIAIEAAEDGEISRGGSTITQQLVKNLFFTTHRNPLRKLAEFVLAPLAELILPKNRILELYLNNAEWGPGVYGAEAAARHHFGRSARSMSREDALRLAAILPAPRRWRPSRMVRRAANIDTRMRQMGY